MNLATLARFLTLAATLLSAPALAQVIAPGIAGPAAFENPLAAPKPLSTEFKAAFDGPVRPITLPFIDNAAEMQFDFANPQPGKRLRIGVSRPLTFDPAADGVWARLPDGSRLWACEVVSPSAYQIGVHLIDVELPPGARLVSYSTLNPADIQGPFTSRGPLGDGNVWTPQHVGQTVRIEAWFPADYAGPLPLRIETYQHVYRNMFVDPEVIQPAAAGTCHNDVNCYPTWANTAKAVGRMTFVDGASVALCTGQLLTTTANDFTPYFLTANHCIGSYSSAATNNTVAASLYVCWNYNTTACGGSAPTALNFTNPPNWTPRTAGSTIVSATGTVAGSDYCLLLLTGEVPANLFWAGWTNAAVATNTQLVGIHHPSGDYKRISFGYKGTRTADCTLESGTSLVSAEWTLPFVAPTSGASNLGITEGGSSGSGIFIDGGAGQYLLIGTLSCGPSACGVAAASRHDSYGAFSATYGVAAVSNALAAGSDDSPGGNNSCANARALTPTTSTQTLSNLILRATPTYSDWYKFTIPGGARLNVSAAFTAGNGNIDLQAFTACGGGVVASTSGSTSPKALPSTITNPSTAPMDVWVRVYLSSSFRNTYSLSYSYTAGAVATPDSCSTPQFIPMFVSYGTNVGSTNSINPSCGSPGAPDVWLAHTAGFTGILQIDTCGSALDTVVSVHSACPAGAVLNEIACNDNTAGCAQAGRSLVQVNVTNNATYWIRVAGAGGATGPFQVNLTQVVNPPPANDNCASATPLPVNGSVLYDNNFATTDGPSEVLCSNAGSMLINNDVWFTYLAPYKGTATFSNCADTAFNSRIAVYDGACPSGPNTAIACDDDGCTGSAGPSTKTVNIQFGHTYRVRLGGYSAARGAGTLVVSSVNTCPCDRFGPGQTPGPDGEVTVDDLLGFLPAFFAQNVAIADYTAPGGNGIPDGSVTVDDLVYFLPAFFAGCP